MDSTDAAVVLGVLVGGLGSLLVPRLIARIPEVEPEEPPQHQDDASVSASDVASPDAPEPFDQIARSPGLAWKAGIVGAVAGAVIGAAIGWDWALLLWLPLVPAYVALAVVDWRTRLLPTYIIAPAYGVVVAVALVGWVVTRDTDALVHAALGWLVYGGLFALLWFIYPRGLGYGDVRLAGLLGIALGWLGWGPVLVGMYAGLLLGGVLGLVLVMLKVVDRGNNPFGPYMLTGALIGIVWGSTLWTGLVGG
jgi:leader peptidase (prepilin peptidase) / N-methyltransferase